MKNILKASTILICIVALLVLTLSACQNVERIPKEIEPTTEIPAEPPKEVDAFEQFNENSSLPFPLLLTDEELRKDKSYNTYKNIHGMGKYRLSRNNTLFIDVSGYPDAVDNYCVTGFEIVGDNYSMLGISIHEDINKAKEILTELGYTEKETNVYEKDGKITIQLWGETTVEKIKASVITTNVGNVVF